MSVVVRPGPLPPTRLQHFALDTVYQNPTGEVGWRPRAVPSLVRPSEPLFTRRAPHAGGREADAEEEEEEEEGGAREERAREDVGMEAIWREAAADAADDDDEEEEEEEEAAPPKLVTGGMEVG